MSEIQAANRCTGSCPLGRQGEVYFTTQNTKQHIHLPYSSIRLWAEEVEEELCSISSPPYYLSRFQSPKKAPKPQYSKPAQSPSTPILVPSSPSPPARQLQKTKKIKNGSRLPAAAQAHASQKSRSYNLSVPDAHAIEASSPPTADGRSIDNLSRYMCWLQARFPMHWELLEMAEAKLNDCGFVFKSVVKRENLQAVIGIGVPAGIAIMLVDEVNSYKRFCIYSSIDNYSKPSNKETDEESHKI